MVVCRGRGRRARRRRRQRSSNGLPSGGGATAGGGGTSTNDWPRGAAAQTAGAATRRECGKALLREIFFSHDIDGDGEIDARPTPLLVKLG